MAASVLEEKTASEIQYIDELPKAVEATNAIQYDAEEEMKAVRKLDWHLITM